MRPSTLPQTTSELFDAEVFLGEELERMKVAGGETRGAVYTKQEVVDFILDLSGYRYDAPLWQFRFMEPSYQGRENMGVLRVKIVSWAIEISWHHSDKTSSVLPIRIPYNST